MYVVSEKEVADAVLTTLSTWLDYTLAALELERNIPVRQTPRPNSLGIFHSADFDLKPQGDDRPMVEVTVKPNGQPQRLGNGQSIGFYEIQIAAVVVGQDEAAALDLGHLYGAAVMGVIEHNSDLGGLVTDTWLISQPETEFFDPAGPRRVTRTTTIFRTKVDSLVNDTDPNPESDGTLPPGSTPTTVNITVAIVPIDESIDD